MNFHDLIQALPSIVQQLENYLGKIVLGYGMETTKELREIERRTAEYQNTGIFRYKVVFIMSSLGS